MARIVVGAVGAVIGFYLGGPVGALQGFTLAYGLSAGLDPNAKVLGPKLADLKAPTASYGAPISYVEGAPRLAGNVIWSSSKREVASTSTTDGKGGPGVDSTTFTYELDVLVELAINRCEAIRRIWSNGKLVWSNAEDSDSQTRLASLTTTSWRDLRFYDGGPGQLPDPTYEAAVGVGNAPAYRGRTTVMVEGLNLGGSGQLPILTFEVVSEAGNDYTSTDFGSKVLDLDFSGNGESQNTAGVTAMALGGFQFLYGTDYNNGSGLFENYGVFDVSVDGAVSLANSFVLPQPSGGTMHGTTDESCIVAGHRVGLAPVLAYTVAFADGSYIELDTSATRGRQVFAKRGDVIVMGGQDLFATGNDFAIRRFRRSDGLLMGTSVPMATEVQSIAVNDSYIFALSWDNFGIGDTIYQLDVSTLALVDTLVTPFNFNQSALVCDEDGDLYVFTSGTILNPFSALRWEGGSTWTLIWDSLPDMFAGAVAFRHSNFTDGTIFGSQYYDNSGAPTERFVLASATVAIELPTLDQVVRRLCLRTGLLTDADIDVTDLSHDVAIADGFVRAMAISQVSTTRATIQTLMAAYLFECVEGETLRFVRRGGNSVVTIPFDDMGASADGAAEPLPLKRANDIEAAARVSVKYANTLNDFQDGLEAADRLVTESTAEQVVELPLGFQPGEAKKLADANTLDLAVTLIQIGPIALSREYSYLEPTDVVTLTNQDGSTFRARIVKGTIGGGLLAFELALDDATVINSAAATDDDYVSSTLIRLLSDSDLEMLDIAILRDADDALGPYAAISAGPKWSGAQLDKSIDDVTFTRVGTFVSKTAVGEATTVLADFTGGGTFDEDNAVTVDVGDSTLASYTKDEAVAGTTPGYLIGSEILIACTATLVSPGVYTLTSMLRGQRGTESFIATHGAAERVVLLQPSGAGLRKVSDDLADLNATRYYRATTIGKSTADSDVEPFVDTGVALKPFAPVDLRVNRDSGFVIEWNRRSRLSSVLLGTTEPPLGETTESYDVEISIGPTVYVSDNVTEPEYEASVLLTDGDIAAVIFGLKTITATRVAILQASAALAANSRALVALDVAGAVAETTGLGFFKAWDHDGDECYVAVDDYPTPATLVSSQIRRYTLASFASGPAATNSMTLGELYTCVASDGSSVWAGSTDGNIYELHETTLAQLNAYPMGGGAGIYPLSMVHLAGKLYISISDGSLVKWDIATQTADWTVSVPAVDLYVNAGVLMTNDGAGAYSSIDKATGAVIDTVPALMFSREAVQMKSFAELDGVIFCQVGGGVVPGGDYGFALFDAATGDYLRFISWRPAADQLLWLAGADADSIYVAHIPSSSNVMSLYHLAGADFSGYTVTVWQRSSIVGRGYPATLEL